MRSIEIAECPATPDVELILVREGSSEASRPNLIDLGEAKLLHEDWTRLVVVLAPDSEFAVFVGAHHPDLALVGESN